MTDDLFNLPGGLRAALTDELQHGERILYAGQPDWCAEWGKLLALFLFGVFWSSISFIFFGISAGSLLGLVPMTSNGQPAGLGMQIFIFVFSLPFVAIGLAFLAAPFLGIAKSRRTVHAVTDTRVLNVYAASHGGAESYNIRTINFVKRRDRRDGFGSLSIGYGVEKDSDGDPRPLALDWSGIPEAKRAETMIYELRNRGK